MVWTPGKINVFSLSGLCFTTSELIEFKSSPVNFQPTNFQSLFWPSAALATYGLIKVQLPPTVWGLKLYTLLGSSVLYVLSTI